MLARAGQTAGPNWLIFEKKPMGTLGVTKFVKLFLKLHGQRQALQLVVFIFMERDFVILSNYL